MITREFPSMTIKIRLAKNIAFKKNKKKIESACKIDHARKSHSDQRIRLAKHITLKYRKKYALSYLRQF